MVAVTRTEPCSTGCCDGHPEAETTSAVARHGWKAAVLGVLCVVGCLAGPLIAGGVATATGALSGELLIGVAVAVAIVGVALPRRRRAGNPGC